jgi:hypothetical protein
MYLDLAVECKNIAAKSPLVVSGKQRPKSESFHDVISDSPGISRHVQRVSNTSLYLHGGFVGKSSNRLRRDPKAVVTQGDSDIYDKWAQALSSSYDLIKEAFGRAPTSTEPCEVRSVVLPVVVIPNERLWTAQYGNDGELTSPPKIADECSYYVGRRFTDFALPFTVSHIHICTLASLERMIREASSSASDLFEKYMA